MGKIKENALNPQRLLENILVCQKKRLLCTDVCVKVEEDLKFDPFTISELFKKLYSNLANDLVHKLPAASKKFGIENVKDYYNDMFELSHNELNFQTVQPNTIFNLLKSFNVNKAAGIDNVFFWKDGADVLGIPITQTCNLAIKLSHFPKDCKVAKLQACVHYFLKRYIKFKNLDEIAITTNVYLYNHYQKTKTLCRHFSRLPTFADWG